MSRYTYRGYTPCKSETVPYRLRMISQRITHPSLLGLRCSDHDRTCEYLEHPEPGKHRIKCGWFGHESTRPYERPRACRFPSEPIPPKAAVDAG